MSVQAKTRWVTTASSYNGKQYKFTSENEKMFLQYHYNS